ncbi:MAG TPA: hypothetical protein VGM88_15240 [Kofleriaceae bacterium]
MTYERLKSFCEANNISMSQLVETQVNGFLGDSPVPVSAPVIPASTHIVPTHPAVLGSMSAPRPMAPRPIVSMPPRSVTAAVPASIGSIASHAPVAPRAVAAPSPAPTSQPSAPVPMTSAAARIAVEPPPPIIKPRPEAAAPKPAEKRADQIFTF